MIEGEITGFTSEGQGILRQNNFVVFVPFTALHDKVTVELTEKKKSYGIGQLLDILEPSLSRIDPRCVYYENCGGCQFQHINYEAQLEAKRLIVENALKRIGKFEQIDVPPVISTTLNWAYRKHVTLHLRAEDQKFSMGFIAQDNHSLVEVEGCPIFIDEKDSLIQEVRTFISNFKPLKAIRGTAVLFKATHEKLILKLDFDQTVQFKADDVKDFLAKHPRFLGISLQQKDQHVTWGEIHTYLKINGMDFICSPFVFTQNHPEQSVKIYHQILKSFENDTPSKILDLYCGIGISSLLLAQKHATVCGIEYTPQAVEFAKQNAIYNGIKNAQFLQGDVEEILMHQLKKETFDLIVTNPPRIGMTPGVIEQILQKKPKAILYISCMPSTLARDLQLLCKESYKIEFIQPYDMFPQTSHVETVVKLVKN
jgi:23S rRNA (uracil1939-C5)-methyltransferase